SIMQKLEKEIKDIPEVAYYTTNVGKGNPQIYYNVLQKKQQSNFGEFFVQLKKDVLADEKRALIDHLRKRWTPFEGAKVKVKDFQQGIPMSAPIEVKLLGNNLDTLRSLAGRVAKLLGTTEGTIYIDNPVKNLKSDIQVQINKPK